MGPLESCPSKGFACSFSLCYLLPCYHINFRYCRHDSIEHDASLSRSDFALGDNFNFNETIYSTLASSNPGVDYYNASSAGWTQKERLRIASAANPELKNTGKEFAIRGRESQLYLLVMGDVATGQAPKKFVIFTSSFDSMLTYLSDM